MRKSYILIHAFLLSATLSVFTACSDYLDRDDDDKITEADAFSRYEKVNGMVSDVYAAAKKPTVHWCSSNISATVPLPTNVKVRTWRETSPTTSTTVHGIQTHCPAAVGSIGKAYMKESAKQTL